MNEEFLNKVCDQIISETRIIDNKVYTPFYPSPLFLLLLIPSNKFSSHHLLCPFSFHCKEVYTLNEQETDYVWTNYKKELSHKDKRMIV